MGTIGRASNSVYYTPENTEGSASYFTEFKKYTDPQLLADSTLYTVEVKDHSGAFSAADLPETRYVPNGQPFTIILPLAEGVHWAVADPLTGETLDLTGVEDAESQTLTYTVPAASHPYRFSAHSDQKVIVYEAGLSGALVDLSNELVVGTQSVIVDGMVRGGLTYSDRCTPQQQSYTVLSPDNNRAAIKLVTGNAHNRRFIYRFTGWRVSGSGMVLRPGRVIDLDNASRIYQPITVFVRVDADKLHIYTGGSAAPITGNKATIQTKHVKGPTIDKKAWCSTHNEWATTADVGVGQTAKYYVVIDLPKYDSVTTLDLTVNDTMTGPAYKQDSAKVYEQAPTGGEFNADAVITDAVTEPTKDEAGVLHFQLDYNTIVSKNIREALTAKQVWLCYEAVVTEEAITGHQAANSATLTYANASTKKEHVTEPASTMVFNYAMNLQKQSDRSVPLSGAKFTFYVDEV